MKKPLDVAIIVVGLNAAHYVRECFDSLATAAWHNYTHEIIYVDNGSKDDTLAMLQVNFPDVKVIANQNNLGFCKAANQGAAIANSRYLFFLNDDTLILNDAIVSLITHADNHLDIGALGGRLLNTDGTEQYSGRRFPSPWNAVFGRRSVLTKLFPKVPAVRDYLYKDQLARGEAFDADWVSAAAVLFPKEVFRGIGGFAEDYYYWHEVIFCDRVRKLSKRVALLPGAAIIHHEGKGSGTRPFKSQRDHIINFHRGGYACYCDHYDLTPFNPLRLLVSMVLLTRACILIAGAAIRGIINSVAVAQSRAAEVG